MCFNTGGSSLTTAEGLEPCFLPKVDLAVWWLRLLPDPHSAANQARKGFSILFSVLLQLVVIVSEHTGSVAV